MSGALDLQDVQFAYDGDDVVRGVSLTVAPGEIVCLLGPSGCGKTTCLRIAAGLERLTRGTVRVGGRQVASKDVHVPPEQRRVGLVLQDFALFPHLTVAQNVAFGVQNRDKSTRDQQVLDLLDHVDLKAYADAWPHQLSGGQQQRVALARALAPEPYVMLMDEPFSGLDVTLRADVRQRAVAVLKSRAVPTLIVTHDPDEALAVADRIIIMRDGRVLQAGTPEEVYLNPADPFVMTFFGAPNHLMGSVQNGKVATPFGPISASPSLEGENVAIYFRGTALTLAKPGDGVPMRVEDARLLGPVQRLILTSDGLDAPLIMEQPRRHAVKIGEMVAVCATLDEFHMFSANTHG
ncbi:ABC transporter [Iodidimonas gelatinilytica]|uniref:ABC transporter n=1 Tax=Iodidimonas gelatinilytica TaxID=1236966 RepID=A0A5A7MZ27_9PROT|nr:ABC transporter ATP-binding protein [Iodidimonas gelatinilytica]GER01321.1 ABC transporter [Iodidimonas gelatinilytica]